MQKDNLDWAARTLAARKTLPAGSVSIALGTVACSLASPNGRVPAGPEYSFAEVERFAGIVSSGPSGIAFTSISDAFNETLKKAPMKNGDDLRAASRTAGALMCNHSAPHLDEHMAAVLKPFTDWREAGIRNGVVPREKADAITAASMPEFAASAIGIPVEIAPVAPYRDEAKFALAGLVAEVSHGKSEGYSL
jgi:hypothetical protein